MRVVKAKQAKQAKGPAKKRKTVETLLLVSDARIRALEALVHTMTGVLITLVSKVKTLPTASTEDAVTPVDKPEESTSPVGEALT